MDRPKKPCATRCCQIGEPGATSAVVSGEISPARSSSSCSGPAMNACSSGRSCRSGKPSRRDQSGMPENSCSSHHSVPASSAVCSAGDNRGRFFRNQFSAGLINQRRRQAVRFTTAATRTYSAHQNRAAHQAAAAVTVHRASRAAYTAVAVCSRQRRKVSVPAAAMNRRNQSAAFTSQDPPPGQCVRICLGINRLLMFILTDNQSGGRSMQKCLATLLAALLAAASFQLSANGLALNEQSASGAGTAYAGRASSALDASTIYGNPAGLSRLSRMQISAGTAAIFADTDISDAQGPFGGT